MIRVTIAAGLNKPETRDGTWKQKQHRDADSKPRNRTEDTKRSDGAEQPETERIFGGRGAVCFGAGAGR
jgi:hypothetical protein